MPYNDYPEAASNNARRALRHRDENGSQCGTAVGWTRANQLASRETISHDTTVRTYSFLSRAKVYDTGRYFDEEGNEVCGSIMYDAWGGDAMLRWAEKKVKDMEENRELRSIHAPMQEEEGKAVGYAALFNSAADIGSFEEVIEPGAFDGADMSDVRALFNHDPNMLLARTASGTLSLRIDERGLRYEFTIPDTNAGRDLKELLRRGDINQSSFGFTIDKEDWEERAGMKPKRKIKRIKRLFDVSPVTFPAYQETSVALRSLEAWKEINNEPNNKETPLRDAAEALLI
jgi:HK97 family phage prohead protease